MSGGAVVERRFLLKPGFPLGRLRSGTLMETGFLSTGGSRQIMLVKEGRRRALLVRDRRVDNWREMVMPNVPLVFQALWNLTEGARLRKVRRRVTLAGFQVVVDIYGGILEPLRIGIASLPLRAGVPAELQEFFGREIDDFGEYNEVQLAREGLPPVVDGSSQVGALPFLFKNGILHLVLVTSSSGAKWILPKGNLEYGMMREEVALMEAAEEAGVVGMIEPGGGEGCLMEDGRVLQLFPLRVATLLSIWPERLNRRRVVLPVYRALMRIEDSGLERCIRDISRKLTP